MGLKHFIQNVRMMASSPEERAAGYFFPFFNSLISSIFPGSDSSCSVSTDTAMRISTFFTCCLVRAEGLASLPFSVMQRTEEGSRVAREHPAHFLVHNRPNPHQTAFDFWRTVSLHIDNFGECFTPLIWSSNMRLKRIGRPIENPSSVQVLESDSGECYYEYNGKRYRDYEMLHFKDLSLDGVRGISRIRYNRETLGHAAKLRKFGNESIGVKPPGYFSTEASFQAIQKQQESLSKTWTEGIASGKVPFLPNGLKYNNLMITPDEAQYLDAIAATKEDICGFMRVPPTLVQNYGRATWNNAEQQDLVFVKYTLTPLTTNIEQELNSKVFSEANATSSTPFYCKANTNAVLRGDFKTRTEGYKTLWERGLITGNQVADLEDWNRFEGGDERFIPMNMIPISRMDDFIDNLTEPVNTNVGDQGGSDNSQRSKPVPGFKLNGKDLILNGHEI